MPDDVIAESSALRPTMAHLVRRLRTLIGDPDRQTWTTDTALQETLDADWQTIFRYKPLRIEATRTGGGYVYDNFFSDAVNNWEADVVLTNGSYVDVTADATFADLLAGHWAFASQPLIPIYATGKAYDLYGAAADLLEARCAYIAENSFDVQDASGAKMSRSQKVKNLQDLAAKYRGRQKARTGRMVRTDLGAAGMGDDPSRWAGRGGWQNVTAGDA